jgi:hypothetical protein
MIFSNGVVGVPAPEEQRRLEAAIEAEQNLFLDSALYDVYGGNDLY